MTIGLNDDHLPSTRWSLPRVTWRRALIWGPLGLAVVLGVWHGDACYALAASAFETITEAHLIQWIERTALSCF